MSAETQKHKSLFLLIPALIGISNILVGIFGLFLLGELLYQVLSGFLILPGTLILLYSIREFKHRQGERRGIKHDERSERNRLQAADVGFRFLFVSLLILILLNALKVINEIIFVAVTGPIIAIGVTVYYLGYYWFEQRG